MISDKINSTAEKILKELCGFDVIEKLRRHGYKKVNIAALMMVSSGYRAKEPHWSNAKPIFQFWQMLFQQRYVFLRSLHINLSTIIDCKYSYFIRKFQEKTNNFQLFAIEKGRLVIKEIMGDKPVPQYILRSRIKGRESVEVIKL